MIRQKLLDKRIKEKPSDSCLRYVLLRIRHDKCDASYLIFSYTALQNSRYLVFRHEYYGYHYLYIDEVLDNEYMYKKAKDEINLKLRKEFKDTVLNFEDDFSHIKSFFNKPTAFGYSLPFEFLLAYPPFEDEDSPHIYSAAEFDKQQGTTKQATEKEEALAPEELFSLDVSISNNAMKAVALSYQNGKILGIKKISLKPLNGQGLFMAMKSLSILSLPKFKTMKTSTIYKSLQEQKGHQERTFSFIRFTKKSPVTNIMLGFPPENVWPNCDFVMEPRAAMSAAKPPMRLAISRTQT